MGTYFNPGNESFAQAIRSRIYIDKTGLRLKKLFSPFEIAKAPDFESYMNKYNVIH